jgi:isovaleryl-CoA dehydrogenase
MIDEKVFRGQVRKILQDTLAPIVLDYDIKGEFAWPAYNALADAGFGAIYLPGEYGGGDSLQGLAILVEEMSELCPAFAMSMMVSYQLFGYNVARIGTKEQKEKYLNAVITDKKIGAWALTEPDIGSDAVHIKTTATKEGDEYVINGSKTFITNAPIADYFIVIANSGGKGFESGTAFILEKGMKGLSVSQPFLKHGHRGSPTGQVFLDHVRVPVSQRLGDEGKAFYDMKHSLDIERLMLGPMVIGMLKALLKKSVNYAKSREQFGQPIIQFQMIQEKLAEMKLNLEIVKALTEKGIAMLEKDQSINEVAAALKLYAGRVSVEASSQAMQIHGGNGYMHEYGVDMFLRDAKLFEIGGGTNEMMQQILAKHAIKAF